MLYNTLLKGEAPSHPPRYFLEKWNLSSKVHEPEHCAPRKGTPSLFTAFHKPQTLNKIHNPIRWMVSRPTQQAWTSLLTPSMMSLILNPIATMLYKLFSPLDEENLQPFGSLVLILDQFYNHLVLRCMIHAAYPSTQKSLLAPKPS